MKNTKCCPKCNSRNIVRVPDNQYRHASGNNIYTSTFTLMKKIPVIRYVCCDCGFVENWIETQNECNEIKHTLGTNSLCPCGSEKKFKASHEPFPAVGGADKNPNYHKWLSISRQPLCL